MTARSSTPLVGGHYARLRQLLQIAEAYLTWEGRSYR